MYNFIIAYLLGKGLSKHESLQPLQKTLNCHNEVFNYVKNNPYSSCNEIALNLNLTCPNVNASLIKLWREKKIYRTENKKYYI